MADVIGVFVLTGVLGYCAIKALEQVFIIALKVAKFVGALAVSFCIALVVCVLADLFFGFAQGLQVVHVGGATGLYALTAQAMFEDQIS